MNYNEMTAAQCADWLAGKDGWHYEPPQVDGMGETREYWWKWTISQAHGGRTYAYKPPLPLTLDAADGALREPWMLDGIIVWRTSGVVSVSVYNMETWKKIEAEGPDRMTAEYRAAVAARMEEER